MQVPLFRFGCSVVLLVLIQLSASAQLILTTEAAVTGDTNSTHYLSLGWEPSPDTNTMGYLVGYGYASGECTNLVDVGNAATATFEGLEPGVTYYFHVIAYDAATNTSEPSPEIAFTLPEPPPQPTPPGPPPTLQIKLLDDGSVLVSGTDTQPRTHEIQYLDNLSSTNWQTLGSVTAAADTGYFEIADTNGAPQRFYRSVTQQ
jgi:hypothetical protein